MDVTTINFWTLAGALLLAAVIGSLYAQLLNQQLEWLADKATELSTVIGVLLTLLLALLIVPPRAVGVLFLFFVATGLPQMLRSAYNRSVREPAKAEAQREAVFHQADEIIAHGRGRLP